MKKGLAPQTGILEDRRLRMDGDDGMRGIRARKDEKAAALTSSSPLLRSRISLSQSSSSPSWPAMIERLLSVRGVEVPPGWFRSAMELISEIVGRRVNLYI